MTGMDGGNLRPGSDPGLVVALHLPGRMVSDPSSVRVVDAGEAGSVMWVGSLGELEELIDAAVRATADAAGSGAAYTLLVRAWERLDGAGSGGAAG